MNILYYLNKALGIILLHKASIRSVAKDKNATVPAIFLGLIGLIIGLWTLYAQGKFPISSGPISLSFYGYLLFLLLITVLLYALIHLFARLFGSKEPFMHFFRPAMLSSIVEILSVFKLVPKIGFVVEIIFIIWGIVIGYFIIKEAYQLSTWRSIGVLLLPLVVILMMFFIVGLFIGVLIAVKSFG